MRNRLLITTGLTALLFFLAGCQIWLPGGTRYKSKDGSVELDVPAGWMFTTIAKPKDADLLATKDGVFLQQVVLQHTLLANALPHSKRALGPDLSAFEVAEAVVDDLKADRDRLGLEVKENSPADVGGIPGFKLLLEYRAKGAPDLRLLELRYGAVVGNQLYVLMFVAPARHYFDRDREVFDTAARSLMLTVPKK